MCVLECLLKKKTKKNYRFKGKNILTTYERNYQLVKCLFDKRKKYHA